MVHLPARKQECAAARMIWDASALLGGGLLRLTGAARFVKPGTHRAQLRRQHVYDYGGRMMASASKVAGAGGGGRARALQRLRMRLYVLRRLLVALPSLLIATFIVFALPRLLPGDVVQMMLEEKAYGKDLDDLRAKLGLDRPLAVQYGVWLGEVARGRLGESLWTRQPWSRR